MTDTWSEYFTDLFKVIFHPLTLVGELWDFFHGWFYSRRWLVLSLVLLPGAIIVLVFAVLVMAGQAKGKPTILSDYVALAEREAPLNKDLFAQAAPDESSDHSKDDGQPENLLDDRALLYFRRVLQLENDNKRARYYVATRYANRGALALARKMMSTLAPNKEPGYLPAHAWIAVDLIQQRQKGIKVSDQKLEHHLSMASTWPQVSAQLLVAYVQFLASRNDKENAIRVLQMATRQDESLLNESAIFARMLGQKGIGDQMAERSVLYNLRKIEEDDLDEFAYLKAAQAYILLDQFEQSVQVLSKGLLKLPNSADLRRSLSKIFVEQFRKSVRDEEGKFEAGWGYLQNALSVDPFNPDIGEQIAWMMQKEVALRDEYQAALRRQLADGKASSVTHLILASISVQKGKMDEGKQHLATAYGLTPNASVVANNYAMILTMVDPPELAKARQLIDEATSRDPSNAELWDSRGRIVMLQKDLPNAIASFERSIGIDGKRLNTRTALVEAYEKSGMAEMADAQRQAIADLPKPTEN